MGHHDQLKTAAADFVDRFAGCRRHFTFQFGLSHTKYLSEKVGGLRAAPHRGVKQASRVARCGKEDSRKRLELTLLDGYKRSTGPLNLVRRPTN